jgi:rRNA maturation endonuclease Nob1
MMKTEDYRLSMATSRRRRDGEDVHPMRDLRVHRLRDTLKAVLRMPMSANIRTSRKYGIFCEPCDRWFTTEGAGERFDCPKCRSVYVLEYAVYSRLPADE